jgi:N-acetylglutamate synthase-like GNAT family acetyltransferase
MSAAVREWWRDQYCISTDKHRLDLNAIQRLLATSYWAADRPIETTQRAIEHSLAFGIYHGQQQIGFARVVTDYVTFAYLADVIIDAKFRGQGLGQWLVASILAHPELQTIRRWVLLTRDAHDLYSKFGFTELHDPQRYMERR